MGETRILSPAELRADLKEGRIVPVYLFAGEDMYRSERTARWLRDKVVDPSMGEFNAQTVYADDRSPAEIVEIASAFPMFGGRRFVWVRHAEKLSAGEAAGPLLDYVRRPSESTVLVLSTSKLDRRLRLTSACAERGRVVEFKALTGTALRQQVRRQAQEHGLELSPEAAEALLDLVGEDLLEIDGELCKLALQPTDGQALKAEAVQELVARSRDVDAFSLADRMDRGVPGPALGLWIELGTRGGDVMGAAAIVAWRLRQLAQLRAGLDEGVPAADLGRALGWSPWQLRRLLPLAERESAGSLSAALEAFRRADRRAKSSSLGARLSYDLALLEWAQAGPA
jgi:DNA polymerase-3 subunit delta